MLMLTAVVSFLVLSFAAACRGDFSGFGMIAEGILNVLVVYAACLIRNSYCYWHCHCFCELQK